MAIRYADSLQNTRMGSVITAIDIHASPATLEICTSGGTVLCIVTLGDPSFTITNAASPANARIDMTGLPKNGTVTGAGTQTAGLARIKEGGGSIVVDGLTVGTSGTDIILNSTSLTNGQTVTVQTQARITHG